ncbi:MAG: DUF4296 domain-containing protein [Owenweeksia sp.]
MTVKQIFIFPVLFVLLVSCSGRKGVKVPDDVFRQDTMIAILTDIHLVEGAKLGRRIMGDTVLVDVYYQKVFEKHLTTKEEFEHSFKFYADHPSEMDKIYDQVIENLNSIEVASPRWEDNKDTTTTVTDSVKTVPPDSLRSRIRENPLVRKKKSP